MTTDIRITVETINNLLSDKYAEDTQRKMQAFGRYKIYTLRSLFTLMDPCHLYAQTHDKR